MQHIRCRKRRDQVRLLTALRNKERIQHEISERLPEEIQTLEPVEELPTQFRGRWSPDGILSALASVSNPVGGGLPDLADLCRTPPIPLSPIREAVALFETPAHEENSSPIDREELCAVAPTGKEVTIEGGRALYPSAGADIKLVEECYVAVQQAGVGSSDIEVEVCFSTISLTASSRHLRPLIILSPPKTPRVLTPHPPRLTTKLRKTLVAMVRPAFRATRALSNESTLTLRPISTTASDARVTAERKSLQPKDTSTKGAQTRKIIRIPPGRITIERNKVHVKGKENSKPEETTTSSKRATSGKRGNKDNGPIQRPRVTRLLQERSQEQQDNAGPSQASTNSNKVPRIAKLVVPMAEPRDNTNRRAAALRRLLQSKSNGTSKKNRERTTK